MTTATSNQALLQRYTAARKALESRAPAQAKTQLEMLLLIAPRFAPAHHLLGVCLAELGDLAGAEKQMRQTIALDKRQPAAHGGLADVLASMDRPDEAEQAYRAALALDRKWMAAVLGLARLLTVRGRAEEAVKLTAPFAAAQNPPAPVLEAHTKALVAAGRMEEAVTSSRRAAAAGVPNADLGTAQLLEGLSRFAEAEAIYRAMLARYPDDPRVHTGLAQAIFAQTQNADAAQIALDAALSRRWSPALAGLKAKILNRADRSPEAYALLQDAVKRQPQDASLHAAAATAAAFCLDYESAYAASERALALAPDIEAIQVLAAETSLGAGKPERAASLIETLRRKRPLDQKLISLSFVAQRLMGDARYREIYDYERLVRAYTIEPPEGWSSLEGFLSDLRARLNAIHDGLGEPLDQSLRKGTQTNINLIHTDEPLLKALFAALDTPVADYVARLGHSDDAFREPLRARNTGGHRYHGAWSVRLQPGGGYHVNHVHPDGWISSAFYVDLPRAIEDEGRAGWIKFGEPGIPTMPALEAEHFVKPEPGRLVLFPSYMLHGTVPFAGDEKRLSFAFDAVPGDAQGALPGR